MMWLISLVVVLAAIGGEAALADRLRRGDQEAMRHYFDAYHERLVAYGVRLGLPHDAALDVVQNAFVHLWERRSEIRPGRSVRGLLFRIVATRSANVRRDAARFASDDAETVLAATPGASGIDPAEAADIRTRLEKVLAKLPERRRAVFELCLVEQLTYREAAQVLDISPKTVENHMALAYRAVREGLAVLRGD